MLSLLCLSVLVGVTLCQISPPIPALRTDPGMRYNSTSLGAPIRLDVMMETNCPDSAMAWPELKLTADYYGGGILDLVIYQFQLPYHRWGHLSTQGFHAIRDQQGDEAAKTFIDHMFTVVPTYSSGATEDRTYNQMVDQLANDANIATGIDLNSFKAVLDDYASITIHNWKNACTRGAAGTPWYYLNGLDIGVNYALTFDELRSLIDPLLE